MLRRNRGIRVLLPLLILLYGSSFFGRTPLLHAKEPKTGSAKKSKEDVQKTPEFILKIPVNTIVVYVKATDKAGAPTTDLTAESFKVYEDGKLQTIQTFEVESNKNQSPTGVKEAKIDSAQVSTEANPVDRPVRFIKFVIDDITATSPRDILLACGAIEKYVAADTQPTDQLSFVTSSGTYELPFTDDHQALVENAKQLYKKFMVRGNDRNPCPKLSDYQAQMIVNNRDREAWEVAVQETMDCARAIRPIAEVLVRSAAAAQVQETQYRNRILLINLNQYARAMKHLTGTKMMILLSGGFLSDDLHLELQRVIDAALRSGIVLHTMDIRGLYTTNISAEERGPTRPDFVVPKQTMLMREMSLREDPLFQIASETGGQFFHNNNDLMAGIKKVVESDSHRYLLTYSSSAPPSDGRYHKIKVEVEHPGTNITYRKGYYAQKEQISYERRSKEDLLEAMKSTVELNEIPIQMAYEYLLIDAGKYELALETKVSIVGMPFVQEDQRYRNLIHIVVIVFDENDRYVDGVEKTVELNLTQDSYDALNRQGLISKVKFNVPPGRYKIKGIVRESVQQRLGSFQQTLEIP